MGKASEAAGRHGMTLAECAEHFGLSRERVRQIEKKALQKVRAGFIAKGIDAQAVHEHLADITGSGDFPDED